MPNTCPSLIPKENPCKLLILLSLLLLLAYSNSFQASWQLDDLPNILDNPNQQMTELTGTAIWDSMVANPGKPSGSYLSRPLSRLTLGLNWFFGGDDVTGYHVVNFIIHLGTTWILFLFVTLLYKTPRLRCRYTPFQITFIAICTSLFWALNPIQVQAVTYIVQRMASLATFFSLLTLLFYLKARLLPFCIVRPFLLLLSALCFLCAFFSKENAVIIILTIPVLELLFFQVDNLRKNIWLFVKIIGGISLVCLGGILILKPTIFSNLFNPEFFVHRPFTLWQRLLTEQRIVVFYLSQIFFPLPGRLSIEHDIILSTSLFSPITTILAICFNLSLFVSALLLIRRQPLFSFAIIFFYLNHLIESTILPLELIFEHRNYLPSLFLFLPLAQLISVCSEKTKNIFLIKIAVMFVVALLLSSFAFGTFTRNKDWRTTESLWLDAASKAPLSQRPASQLALYYGFGEDQTEPVLRKALKYVQDAVVLTKSRVDLEAPMLGNVAAVHVSLHEYDEALKLYEKAIEGEPEDPKLYYNYAKLLFLRGDYNDAAKVLSAVLRAGYQHPDLWNLLALVNLWTDNPDRALEYMQAALKQGINRPSFHLHLGKSLALLGYHDKARFFYGRSLYYGKENNILALARIENALLEKNGQQAKEELQRALKDHPLPELVEPLIHPEKRKLYVDMPLESDLLLSYIASEFGDLDVLIMDIQK